MSVKIKKIHADAKLPSYAHPGDAGMDLFSYEEITLAPQERKAVSTGIVMAIPPGYAGLIWDKSGLALNYGLKTMAGVVDSGYRGEVKVVVHNLSRQPCTISKGAKIAQMLIQPVSQKEVVEVEELDETERGGNGFGSSGMS